MKTYVGVQSLDGGGIFYFNLAQISSLKFMPVRKDSGVWEAYIEECISREIEPAKAAYFMTVGHNGGKVNFLVSKKKMYAIKHRMNKFVIDEILGDEEE